MASRKGTSKSAKGRKPARSAAQKNSAALRAGAHAAPAADPLMANGSGRDIAGVALAVFAVCSFIAVIAPASAPITAAISGFYHLGFGLGAYILPLALLLVAALLFVKSEGVLKVRTALGALIIFVSIISLITLIGTPEAVEEVAFRLTKKAAEVIDMTKHHGEHSRMGATDVIPFVPTVNVTVEECVEISKRLGKRIWEELQIPSFLYEDSATSPDRVNLANVRKGQFEGMPEKLLQPEWAPDFGERKIHPTAGITAIGARMPLVAFNINLATSDVNIAKKIAKVIRGSSGGFKCCKAMGFMLEDRGIAQVSMNMVNYEVTPLTVVYEMVDSLAKRYGTYIVGSELVGLTPAKALLDCAEYYLKLENFDCRNQVMEYHVIDMKND